MRNFLFTAHLWFFFLICQATLARHTITCTTSLNKSFWKSIKYFVLQGHDICVDTLHLTVSLTSAFNTNLNDDLNCWQCAEIVLVSVIPIHVYTLHLLNYHPGTDCSGGGAGLGLFSSAPNGPLNLIYLAQMNYFNVLAIWLWWQLRWCSVLILWSDFTGEWWWDVNIVWFWS